MILHKDAIIPIVFLPAKVNPPGRAALTGKRPEAMVRRVKTWQFQAAVALGMMLAAGPATASGNDARAAVSAAETAVAQAAAGNALWTSAEEALRRARGALEAGDPAAATRWAETASEQARLGLAQKQYPLTR